jgi:thiol:disulfide interchange protein DsbC
VRVKGDGSRKLALFSDPDCPFCKRIEQEFLNLDNVTIYTFLYPIDQLHPVAAQKARAVWCAPDRAKAWTELMLRNVQPKAAKCDTPVEKIVAFSEKLKIFGTPTLFLSDGQRIPGMVPAAQLDQLLNSVERR